MSASTETNKRARFDEGQNTTAPSNTNTNRDPKSPTTRAHDLLKSRIELRPTELQPIMFHHGEALLNLHRKIHKKNQIISKMEDATAGYIPRAARLNLTLTVMKATKERDQPTITNLEDNLRAAKEQFETAAKTIFIEAAKEDKKTLQQELLKETILYIKNLAEAYILLEGIGCSVDAKVQAILTHVSTTHFSIAGQISADTLRTAYNTTYQLGTLPEAIPIPVLQAAGQYTTPALYAEATQARAMATQNSTNIGLPALEKHCHDILVAPWQAWIAQNDANERSRAVLKATTQHIEGTATDEAAMLVEQEVPQEQQQIRDLVKNNVAEATKPLLQVIEKQQKQLDQLLSLSKTSSKQNSNQRGQPKPGASNKKKSGSNKSNQGNSNKKKGSRSSKSPSRTRPNNQSNKGKGKGTQGNKGGDTGTNNSNRGRQRSRSAKRASKKNNRSRSRGNRS